MLKTPTYHFCEGFERRLHLKNLQQGVFRVICHKMRSFKLTFTSVKIYRNLVSLKIDHMVSH